MMMILVIMIIVIVIATTGKIVEFCEEKKTVKGKQRTDSEVSQGERTQEVAKHWGAVGTWNGYSDQWKRKLKIPVFKPFVIN